MTEDKKSRRRWIILVFLVLFILLISLVLFCKYCGRNIKEKGAVQMGEVPGDRFEFDDFYYAVDGTWSLDAALHLLKQRKYVSGPQELQHYLVYEAKPSEVVRIKESDARWKLLEVLEVEDVIATGWADLNRAKATKVE